MSAFKMCHAAASALLAAALLGAASSAAYAEVRDYEFRLVKAEMKKGDAEVAVRLVNKKTGKLVPNAVRRSRAQSSLSAPRRVRRAAGPGLGQLHQRPDPGHDHVAVGHRPAGAADPQHPRGQPGRT